MTALDMAILNGDIESAAILTCAGADTKHLLRIFSLSDLYEPLSRAARKEVKEQLLYDEDLDVNASFSRFNITGKSGMQGGQPQESVKDEGLTPLTVAVATDDGEIVKMFLKDGQCLLLLIDN
jgi:ankyrin repeat protein